MTTDPAAIAARKRKLRRRHKRERQAVIFGGVLAGLAAVGLGAAAVWTGSMESPFDRQWTTLSESPTADVAAAPCVPADTLPVPYASITVNVYNGTSRAGLAGAVSDLLGQRGFEIGDTANYPDRVRDVAKIGFGAQGVAAAYTLLAHVPGATLEYDDRTDGSIDLAVGAKYDQLEELDLVPLAGDEPLQSVTGCVVLADAVPAPAPTFPVEAPQAEQESEPEDDGATDVPEPEDGAEG